MTPGDSSIQLANFEVSLRLHRLQVERELRTNWLRLRQAILMAPPKPKIRLGIMLSSNSAFCTLFRHALIAFGYNTAILAFVLNLVFGVG